MQASLECKSEDSAILSVDFSNAFNTLRRDVMLKRAFSEPQLSPLWRLAHWAYRSPSDLLLVRSGEVVLLFCLPKVFVRVIHFLRFYFVSLFSLFTGLRLTVPWFACSCYCRRS